MILSKIKSELEFDFKKAKSELEDFSKRLSQN